MTRSLWSCSIALLLLGCTYSQNHAVVVTPESVHAYAAACSAVPASLTPVGFVYAGWDYVDQQCQIFFDGIVELQKDARYASSSIATANSQAAAIMGLVNAAASSIAMVAAGTELARKLVDGYAAEFAFSPYAVESRKVVFDALSAYRNDKDIVATVQGLSAASPDNYCIAQNVIRNYAKICSLAGIEMLARQAIASAPISRSDSGGGGSGVNRVTSVSPARLRRGLAPAPVGLGLPNFVAGGAR